MQYEVTAIIEHPSTSLAVVEELIIQRLIQHNGLLIRAHRRGKLILISMPEHERTCETNRTH